MGSPSDRSPGRRRGRRVVQSGLHRQQGCRRPSEGSRRHGAARRSRSRLTLGFARRARVQRPDNLGSPVGSSASSDAQPRRPSSTRCRDAADGDGTAPRSAGPRRPRRSRHCAGRNPAARSGSSGSRRRGCASPASPSTTPRSARRRRARRGRRRSWPAAGPTSMIATAPPPPDRRTPRPPAAVPGDHSHTGGNGTGRVQVRGNSPHGNRARSVRLLRRASCPGNPGRSTRAASTRRQRSRARVVFGTTGARARRTWRGGR